MTQDGEASLAIAVAKEALNRHPDDLGSLVLLAASLANSQRAEGAREALARLAEIDVAALDRLWVIRWLAPTDRDRVKDGLRRAGWK